MIALCLCNNMTPSQTQPPSPPPPLIWGRHWALKDRGKPRHKNPANLHSSTKHSLYNNPTPLEFNQATPNAYQMIAPWLFNNMTLSLTEAPLKKYYLGQRGQQPVPTGRAVAPLRQIFWNLHWFLSLPESYLEPMVKRWGWLVVKSEIVIFTLKVSGL